MPGSRGGIVQIASLETQGLRCFDCNAINMLHPRQVVGERHSQVLRTLDLLQYLTMYNILGVLSKCTVCTDAEYLALLGVKLRLPLVLPFTECIQIFLELMLVVLGFDESSV